MFTFAQKRVESNLVFVLNSSVDLSFLICELEINYLSRLGRQFEQLFAI